MKMYEENYLSHYGVVGMKWGVSRALSKSNSNYRLQRKALNYDKKAANFTKKSEKQHAKYDLEGSNKKAINAANLDKKAAKLQKKALTKEDGFERATIERRAERLKYKAATNRLDSNRISKSKGYGAKAMSYSIKSDKAAKKAAKARMKIANNDRYIEKMKRKASTISSDDLQNAYSFVNRLKEIS